MDLQTTLNNVVQAGRHEVLKTSHQLTLGELILKLEPLEKNWKHDDTPKSVRFDFGSAIPTGLSSWRGSYSELAIEYALTGYDDPTNQQERMSLEKFLELLKEAVGKEYTGWKGGEFVMSKNTPLWVANSGNSNSTGVVDVKDNSYEVILITQECEY